MHSPAGFDIEIPANWVGTVDERSTNRSVYRLVLVGNRGLEAPDLAISDWAGVPTDRVVVELVEYFGPPGIPPKTSTTTNSETAFPLDWTKAEFQQQQGQFALWWLRLTNLGRSLGLLVHIGPNAPAADVALLPTLVASLRPEPIPASGTYRSWRVLGPLDAYPVGTVTHFDPAAPNPYGFFLVRGKSTIFAHIDRAFVFVGGFMPCPVRYDPASRTFVCDRAGDHWARVGKHLTGADWLGLAYHPVLIKDGFVLVGSSMIGSAIDDDDSLEFADPGSTAPTQRATLFTRAEILARFATMTAVDPIERSAAKLVQADEVAATGIFGGRTVGSDRVWVVAFSGPVHPPQGNPSQTIGGWTLFAADPVTGGVVGSNCCGQGDWPTGFDDLLDLAR